MIMPKKVVYLAGPITGLSYGEARQGWRSEIATMLAEHVLPLSPMRGKNFLEGETCLKGGAKMYDNVIATPKGIVARDRNDVRTCDVMVACFLGSKAASIGTSVEFGWADAFRKPIVMVIEDGDLHNHAMLTEMAGYIVSSLEQAAEIVNFILTPEV